MDSLFGIGLPELILILVIAGVVMGPERIAHIARWLGKTTAQLQSISRAFVRQLQNELDGVDDEEALRGALSEVQLLREELKSLRSEFVTSTTTQELEEHKTATPSSNSILPPPPSKTKNSTSALSENEDGKESAVSPPKPPSIPPPPSKLPTPLEIEDDPE